MKVAVIHNLRAGGARRRLSEQLTGLDLNIVEVCPATATPVTVSPVVIPLKIRADSSRKARRPLLRYVDQAAVEGAWKQIGGVVRAADVDVVFANPCQFLQAPTALITNLPPSVYFCDEPRRVDHDVGAKRSRSWLTIPLYAGLYRRQRYLDTAATCAASRIITNSAYTASSIYAAYGRHATVIAMGVAEPFRLSDRSGPTPSSDLVLSVGTLIPSKGHAIALEAVALSARRLPLVIVAPRANEAEAARLRRLAQSTGVELRIEIGISDAELLALYQRAFATLYMADREPLGLVALEAQACGSPVIVSDNGGLPETLRHGVTGWACSREPGAVAAYLNRLGDPELRSRMGDAATSHGRTYSWASSAQALTNIFIEVARADNRTSDPFGAD